MDYQGEKKNIGPHEAIFFVRLFTEKTYFFPQNKIKFPMHVFCLTFKSLIILSTGMITRAEEDSNFKKIAKLMNIFLD